MNIISKILFASLVTIAVVIAAGFVAVGWCPVLERLAIVEVFLFALGFISAFVQAASNESE